MSEKSAYKYIELSMSAEEGGAAVVEVAEAPWRPL